MAKNAETMESMTYFSMQMVIHLTRILAANGVEDRLRSAIRQTLAQGIEQFSPSHRPNLDELAQTLFSAVDGGLRDKEKWQGGGNPPSPPPFPAE